VIEKKMNRRRSSYNQTRETAEQRWLDGIRFGSLPEKERYIALKAMQRSRQISALQCHPKFTFIVNDVVIGEYTPDFTYHDEKNKLHVEDVKGWTTTKTGKPKARYNREFPWQKNLMLACFGLKVELV
jgi:hypothetical protein